MQSEMAAFIVSKKREAVVLLCTNQITNGGNLVSCDLLNFNFHKVFVYEFRCPSWIWMPARWRNNNLIRVS